MKLELGLNEGFIHIRGYGRGFIDLPAERITESVIVTPSRIIRGWPPQQIDELGDDHLQIILSLTPEIVLLGCGSQVKPTALNWMAYFYAAGVGFEAMDTGAACRSFNLLASEGRNVAAGLFMIPEE
jgi:uncharacterized protein